MAKPAKTTAIEIVALSDIEALDRCTRGRLILVGIQKTSFCDCLFLNRFSRLVSAILLEQMPVLVDYTRRLETPRLAKSVEEMRDAALAVRYLIERCRGFRSTLDRRVLVVHQTASSLQSFGICGEKDAATAKSASVKISQCHEALK
jgi:hypothetical protein